MKMKLLKALGGSAEEIIKLGTLKLSRAGQILKSAREALFYSLSAFLLGSAGLAFGVYPFGIALLASVKGAYPTAFSFLGAILSTLRLERGAIAHILAYLFILLSRFLVCFFKGDLYKKEGALGRIFHEGANARLCIVAFGALFSGIDMILSSASVYYGTFSAFFGIAAGAAISGSFILLFDKKASGEMRAIGLCALLSGLCRSLSSFGFPFNIGAVAAFSLSSLFASVSPVLASAVGLCTGLSAGWSYSTAFGIGAFVCSLLWNSGKVLSICAYALCASFLSLIGGGFDAIGDIIPEIAFAAALCAPVLSLELIDTKKLSHFTKAGEFIKAESEGEVGNLRFRKMGEAFSSLSQVLREISDKLRLPTKAEAYRICAGARAKYCRGCEMEKECMEKDESTVSSMFKNMAYRLSSCGKVSARIVPDSVSRRCYKMDAIIDSVNTAARKASRLSGDAKKAELFASDYSALGDILTEISSTGDRERDRDAQSALQKALSAVGFEAFDIEIYGKRKREIYIKGVDLKNARAGGEDIKRCAERVLLQRVSDGAFSIDGDRVDCYMHTLPEIKINCEKIAIRSKRDLCSGDSAQSFESSEGYYYTVLSDGMGSGREAAIASGISCLFLEKLLSSGCPMKSALELLNAFQRGSGGECFTTVDLMEADLYTKKARFIKSGAAPSFVLRRGNIYRLHSKTVPVGIIRALDAEALSFELAEGDIIIMLSDGVTGSYEDCPWLYALLSGELEGEGDPKIICQTLARAAAKETEKNDDITVCVMTVEKG